eukprot:UN07920
MNQKNSSSDNTNTTKQSNSHEFLKAYLPSWISHPVSNIVDACIDSVNPFNNNNNGEDNNKSTSQNPLEVPLFDQDALDLLYNSASAPSSHELGISQTTCDNSKLITNQQEKQLDNT